MDAVSIVSRKNGQSRTIPMLKKIRVVPVLAFRMLMSVDAIYVVIRTKTLTRIGHLSGRLLGGARRHGRQLLVKLCRVHSGGTLEQYRRLQWLGEVYLPDT